MKIIPRRSCLLACALGTILWPLGARAYLGGFEEQDGYRVPLNGQILSSNLPGDAQFYLNNNAANGYTGVVPLGAYPNNLGDSTNGPDVTRYNAGQYGTNGGGTGGTAQDIPDNSGLWQALSGGRLYEDATAPYYYGSQFIRNQIVAYRNTTPHGGSQTLNLMASSQSLSYLYTMDSRDFGGLSPASTAGMQTQMSFWVKPTDWDDQDTGNIFGLSLLSAANQPMFEVGYTGDNRLEYRLTGGAWQVTSYSIGTLGWSEITVVLDTQHNTATLELNAYNDSSSLLGGNAIVLSSQAIGVAGGALTALQWDLQGGTLPNGAISYINSFDDFSFSAAAVPEPQAMVLMLAAAFLLCAPRRRMRR